MHRVLASVLTAGVLLTVTMADDKPTGPTSGSFLLVPKTLFTLSTSDKQVGLNLFRDVSTEPWAYYLLIQAGVDQGKGQLFDGKQLGSSVSLTGEFRRRANLIGDYYFLRPSIGAEEYKTFLASDPVGDQIKKQRKDLRSLSLGYVRMIGGTLRVGVSAGYQEGTNADDLKSVEIRDVTTESTATGTREIVTSQQVKQGRLERKIKTPFSLDLLAVGPWLDNKKSQHLSYGFFARKDLRDSGSDFVPGIALYVSDAEVFTQKVKDPKDPSKFIDQEAHAKDPDHPKIGISLALKDGKILGSVSVGSKF